MPRVRRTTISLWLMLDKSARLDSTLLSISSNWLCEKVGGVGFFLLCMSLVSDLFSSSFPLYPKAQRFFFFLLLNLLLRLRAFGRAFLSFTLFPSSSSNSNFLSVCSGSFFLVLYASRRYLGKHGIIMGGNFKQRRSFSSFSKFLYGRDKIYYNNQIFTQTLVLYYFNFFFS